MSRIFLLEDHASFRQALASVLDEEQDLDVVSQAGSLAEARNATSPSWGEIDVAIVDILLPDGAGPDLIGEMREINPGVPVVTLTIVQDPETLEWAQEMGADEVISKASRLGEIVDAIRRLTGE